jgi:hypothetical protein
VFQYGNACIADGAFVSMMQHADNTLERREKQDFCEGEMKKNSVQNGFMKHQVKQLKKGSNLRRDVADIYDDGASAAPVLTIRRRLRSLRYAKSGRLCTAQLVICNIPIR